MQTRDGEHVPFDRLLLATDARAHHTWPHMSTLAGVHSVRAETDGRALSTELAGAQQVVIAGAGLIGLEIVAAATDLGCQLTVVETADRVLPARSRSRSLRG